MDTQADSDMGRYVFSRKNAPVLDGMSVEFRNPSDMFLGESTSFSAIVLGAISEKPVMLRLHEKTCSYVGVKHME